MPVLKKSLDADFTAVPNETVTNNDDLSWKARGLLLYLLGRPPDWQFRISHLVEQAPDGRTATKSGLDELEAAGFLSREPTTREDGGRGCDAWYVYDRPKEASDPPPSKIEGPHPRKSKGPTLENRTPTKERNRLKDHDQSACAQGDDPPTQWEAYTPLTEREGEYRQYSPMHVRSEWRQQVGPGHSVGGDQPADETACQLAAICQRFSADEIDRALTFAADRHRQQWRWFKLCLHTQRWDDDRHLAADAFLAAWQKYTEQDWGHHLVDRMAHVLAYHRDAISTALKRTARRADRPGWDYFRSTLESVGSPLTTPLTRDEEDHDE